jgi:hypothetical protein
MWEMNFEWVWLCYIKWVKFAYVNWNVEEGYFRGKDYLCSAWLLMWGKILIKKIKNKSWYKRGCSVD